ncbi:MAG: hypothetical protein HQM11_00910 [SAR324 cluster bacterium]|nr:hypothetical protein [SAR324 cluster bacterium]
MAEKKKEEGQIINEDIFGKDWESSDPKEGLTHLKIIAKNIGNIPGLVTHWEGDIKKRHDEILKAKNATFIMRAKAMLGGKFGKLYWEGVTGEDLAQHHPTKTATDLVERLKTDPMDYQARIALVTLLGQTGRELPVEVYRTMLLQSTVANTFGVFSIPGIQVALWAQNTYLNQLQAKCRHDVRTIENKILLAKKATGTEEQIKTLERLKAVINRNIRVIQEYMTHAAKATELSKYMFTEMFDINDIERQLNSDQSKPELKQHLYVKAYAIIHFLRFHLLLQTYAVDITDKFVLHDKDNSLGYFLKARVYMSEMTYMVNRFRAGAIGKEIRKDIQELFKKTYHFYGLALRRTGSSKRSLKKKGHELTILLEYASVLRYFIQTSVHLLNIQLPRPWILENLKRVQKLLQIQLEFGDKMVKDLLHEVENDLNFYEA